MSRLKEYRERYGLTQDEAVAAIHRHALARGDKVIPGLDQCAISRHENGHKRPSPYYQQLYCEVYGATPVDLGFRLALPSEIGHHDDDVDRRKFLTGAAGLLATAALPSPPTQRLGGADVVRLRQSVIHLYKLDDQHGGAGGGSTVQLFNRLRGFVASARYDDATGQALRELTGQTAQFAGWLAFDADQHDEARRWWLEALHWSELADTNSVGVLAMACMARQASDQRRPREAIDLATAAQRSAGSATTPRLSSILLAREALGHAGAGDAGSAHAVLRRAHRHADQARHDDDPRWIDFYGPAEFALHEYYAALLLGDLPAAEDAVRTALSLNDPVAYPRNRALYLVRLADVLAQRREIGESAAIASQAATAAADVDSGRVTRGLHAVARRLTPYRGEPAVGEFLALV